MRTVTLLILLTLLTMSNVLRLDNENLSSSDFMGKWVYVHSEAGDTVLRLDIDEFCPVDSMVFKVCNDSIELLHMPSVIKNLRKGNILENIKCDMYAGSVLIDNYYPVVRQLNSTCDLQCYGNHLKEYYTIWKLSGDTMHITNGRTLSLAGKKYLDMNHVYIKRHE